MPVVIDATTQDFPDSAQRFNWCNCQAEAPRLTAALGQITPGQLVPGDVPPPTPIFDFAFWNQELNGGGGVLPVNQTGSPGNVLPAAGQLALSAGSWLLPGALLIGALWFFTSRRGGGKGRRR